jgi:hypothetical protein
MWISAMHLGGLLLGLVLFLSVCVAQSHAAAARAAPAVAAANNMNGPFQTFKRTIMESRRHLAAAAVARSTSIFLMYPMDTIKVSSQSAYGKLWQQRVYRHFHSQSSEHV